MTPDAPKEQAALEMGQRLDEVLAHDRTGTNVLTFLLPEHTPVEESGKARVATVFQPAHYARLAVLKKLYDPRDLFGVTGPSRLPAEAN